jgi:hypothetical protein
MLVVISDLHLTDGTAGSSISPGAFRLLAERLADLVASASTRSDGSYRPIDHVDLVLLGDVLDVIRSARWLGGTARPWDDPQSPAVVETLTAITTDILRRNEESLGLLRSLAQGLIRLTPPSRMDRQPVTNDTVPVPVRIHYMVGNHDWYFHLPGPHYQRLRQQIAVQMGLATNPNAPFPHEPWECETLHPALLRHKVFARHGDVYDPFNYEGHRDGSSLGDAIVIELVGRFAAEMEQGLAEELPEPTRLGLRELDNIRPLLLVPVWIDGLLERTCPSAALRQHVKTIWDALADAFLEHRFVRERDTWRPRDLVDGLERALKISRRVPVGWASSIAAWLCEIRGARTPSYCHHALAEPEFRNRRARHIVYGHTHYAEEVPLDASYADGFVLHQTYFNAGTWRRVYRPTHFAPNEHEFIPSDTLSFLTFFQGDERNGRPYETWTGTLGINPNTVPPRRIDSPTAAQQQPAPLAAPHFDRSPMTTSITTDTL